MADLSPVAQTRIDLDLLMAFKSYIETMKTMEDGEWGDCRSAAELIAADEMPELYSEVIARINLIREGAPPPVIQYTYTTPPGPN